MEFLRPALNASQSSSSKVSLVRSESEDPPAELAKEVMQQPFTTNKSLQRFLEIRHRVLQTKQNSGSAPCLHACPPGVIFQTKG
ncbi:hypothetical protein BJX63DRAFT_267895 [Aspergillus granulosus]|uniref:Uncharacterized protein n=1 Tax=Aspergillus granulosus TaxID=176169 RepID=A0ABR4H8J8_9EURO